MSSIFHLPVDKINGSAINLADYRGKALLVVNVAFACGLTPQYEALEKIVVKGESQHPLYKHLTNEKTEAQQVNAIAFEEKLKGYGINRTQKNDILWKLENF